MITPALSNAPTAAASTVSHEPGPSLTARVGPYAVPTGTVVGMALDAVMIDAIRTASGPFVPAPWRDQHGQADVSGGVGSSASAREAVPLANTELPDPVHALVALEAEYEVDLAEPDLPWIDAFSDIPEMGTVSQVTREEQGEQESSFVDVTLFPGCDDAAAVDVDEPAVAESVSYLSPLPAEADCIDEPVTAEASGELVLLFGPDAALMSEATAEPSFESAWEEAEPIEEDAGEELARESVMESAGPDQMPQEDWPLAEAADSLRMLADAMPASTHIASGSRPDLGRPYATPLGVPPIAMTPPLPMWDDEDSMDIMPVKVDAAATRDPEHWSRAVTGASTSATEVGAAVAIEAIAQRIRRGDLAVPGYSEGMSDAATLAAALTALLSATV